MKIEGFPVGQMKANCYVVYDEETREAVMIDPGDEGEILCGILGDRGLRCKHVLATHNHSDHVSAAPIVLDYTDAVFYMSYDHTLEVMRSQGRDVSIPTNARNIKDGDVIECGSLSFKVMATPGHTPDSVCFICGDAIFTGDTLFRDACGAGPELPNSDWTAMQASLKKLARLPGDYDIYPGHRGRTTLERERKENVFVKVSNAWRPSDDEPGAQG